MKVIFHINESTKWNHLIANVTNLINDFEQEQLTIEVVANGLAVVDYYNNDSLLKSINELRQTDVTFNACRNSLISHHLNEAMLPDAIHVVPAGVSEIIKRQNEGYSYIKV